VAVAALERERVVLAATDEARKAGLQSTIAQSRLDSLQAASDLRRLAVQGSVVDLTRERLGLLDCVAPMLVAEESLQNEIRTITRENLDLTRERLQAQSSALGPQEAVAGFEFTRAQANARVGLSISQIVAGQTPTFDIGEQILTGLHALPIFNPEAAQANLANVEGQRGVQVADFAVTADQLRKNLAAIPQRQALQGLELGPGGIAATTLAPSVNQAQAGAIDRSLQTVNLLFSPDVVAAEQALATAH
jgi:hypothetical protein